MAKKTSQIDANDPTMQKVAKGVAIAIIVAILAVVGVLVYILIEWILGL